MKNQNFTTTFTVDQTAEEAFKAIKNVRGWWSEVIEGSTEKLGDEFTYRFKDVHHCKMKLVVVNHFNFTEDKTEWKGTKIIVEISQKDDKSEIRFTHFGLVPDYEC